MKLHWLTSASQLLLPALSSQAQTHNSSWLVAQVRQPAGTRGVRHVIQLRGITSLNNPYYRLDIFRADGKSQIASETFRNGVRLEKNPDALRLRDMDGDGYQDIVVPGGGWFKVWRYDAKQDCYVWGGTWTADGKRQDPPRVVRDR